MTLTGKLVLKAAEKNGRTILTDTYFDGAFKLSRPVFFDDQVPTYFLIHVGGGYVSGDTYHQSFHLEEGAELTLTTQSAAKVYKTTGGPARQHTDIYLGQDSFLTLLQDPVIAFEHARYAQETAVRMEKGSGLILTDIFTPGWSEDRREFSYDWIRSRMDVFYEGKRIIYDNLVLQREDLLSSMLQLEGFTHYGSLLFIHEELNETVMEMIWGKAESFQGIRAGMSRLTVNGFFLRILANQTQVIEKAFSECETILRKKVLKKMTGVFYRKY
ncbi:urease accessory protein UreD [Bacillus massiliglaciei]|uniref:urease accessory protein UreD n=1 Tax=Bacillus massiliglaciei TaxID=1816693 RepID=UPI000A956333|nr:urease accessory protein UreD [Bacillus massiliglaciei]